MLSRFKLFLAFLAISVSAWGVTATDYYQAGNAFYQQGQWEKAAQYYGAALKANPSMWEAQMGLGNADYRLGKTAEAVQAYDQSLALHPDNPSLKAFADKLRSQVPNNVPSTSPGDSWSTPPASLPLSNTAPANSAVLPGATTAATPEWKMENKYAKMTGLPVAGKFAFVAGSSGNIYGSQDFKDFYGPYLNSISTAYGGDLYLGADYTIMPNFQMGLQAQGLYKVPMYFSDSFGDTWTWREFGIGGAVVGRGLMSFSSNINLGIRLEGGFYTLIASGVDTYYSGSGSSFTSFSASNFGGLVGVELEILQNIKGTWALDFGVGYRFLTFTPITASNSSGSGILKNWDFTTDSRLDFSGVRFSAGVRFN